MRRVLKSGSLLGAVVGRAAVGADYLSLRWRLLKLGIWRFDRVFSYTARTELLFHDWVLAYPGVSSAVGEIMAGGNLYHDGMMSSLVWLHRSQSSLGPRNSDGVSG